MRLIDADAFARWLDKEHHVDKPTGKCDYRQNRVLGIAISAAKNPEICPTIDAAPVVHARWVSIPIPSHYGGCVVECSKCYNRGNRNFSFCPSCGAKMDGGAADG